jgi:hypothetical protein
MRLSGTEEMALHCQRAYLASSYKVRTSHRCSELLWHSPKSIYPRTSLYSHQSYTAFKITT